MENLVLLAFFFSFLMLGEVRESYMKLGNSFPPISHLLLIWR